MRRRSNKKTLIIGVLFCVMVFMGIGFAVTIRNLNVSSTGTVSGSWDIQITNIANVATGYAQNDSQKTAIKDSGKSADLAAVLYAPLDKVTYTLTVTNNGNINAYLQSLVVEENTHSDFIKVTNTVTESKKIDAGQSITFDVVVEFLNYKLESIPNNIAADFTIIPTYVQEANEEDMNIDDSVYNSTYKVNSSGEITGYDYGAGNYVEVPSSVTMDNRDGTSTTRDITTITENSFKSAFEYDIAMYETTAIVINGVSGESYSTLRQATIDFIALMVCRGSESCLASSQFQENLAMYTSYIKPEGVTLSENAYTTGKEMDSFDMQMMAKYENGALTQTNTFSEADVIMFNTQEIIINKTGSDYTSTRNALLTMIGEMCLEAPTEDMQTGCNEAYSFSVQPEGSVVSDNVDSLEYMTYDTTSGEMDRATASIDVKVLDLSKATNLETIESNAFYGSTTLTTVVLPDNRNLQIDQSAFASCPNLTIVTTASKYIGGQVLNKEKYNITKLGIENNKYNVLKIDDEEPTSLIIGYGAFQNSNISTLNLPDNTTSIGDYAFINNSITSFALPPSVTNIGSYAFNDNSINSLDLSRATSFTSLNSSVFANNNITSLTIPSNITSAASNAFYRNNLSELTLSNCSNICSAMGANTSSLKLTINSGSIPNDAFTVQNHDADHKDDSIASLILGNGVTNIGSNAFYGNAIQNLSISSGVTSIGSSAFEHNQLTSVTISSSVTSIGSSAFQHNNMESLTIPSGVTSIGSSAFDSNRITSLSIPSSVTTIEYGAFANQEDANGKAQPITNATIASMPSTFDESVFTSITNLTINGGTIPSNTFQSKSIESLVLGNGVTSIGESAFSSNKITNLTIPSSVTSIGSYAFTDQTDTNENVKPITNVTIASMPSTFNSNAFSSITNLTINSGEIPTESFYNKSINSLTLGSGVTSIGSNAFSLNKITNLEIPSTVTSIGGSAFASQEDANGDLQPITNVIIQSMPTINTNSFTAITNLTINSGQIPNDSFYNKSISSLTLGNGVTSIGSYAFASNSISNITIPTRVTSIGDSAFYQNQITDLTIGSGVISIGSWAFYNNSISTLNLNNSTNLTTIGQDAFSSNQITTLTLPTSLTNIGNGAFAGNIISSLAIPSGVVSIGEQAFVNNQISSLDLSNATGLTTIERQAFQGNQISELDFSGATSLTTVNSMSFLYNIIETVVFGNTSVPFIGGDYGNPITSVTFTNCSSYCSLSDVSTNGTVIEDVTINSGAIPASAFSEKSITSLTIGNGVTSIGQNAFSSNSINTLDLSGATSLTSIGNGAFMYNEMTSLTLGNNVSSIESHAFRYNKLSSITLPSSITNLGYSAFGNQAEYNGGPGLLSSITINMSQSDFESNVTKNSDWYDKTLAPTITYNP